MIAMPITEVDRPVPGLYRLRLAKDAPWSPVRVWDDAERDPETGELLEDENFRCLVNGVEVNPHHYAERINCFGETIDEVEYQYLLSLNEWAADHAPESPEANPLEGVDINTAPPIF